MNMHLQISLYKSLTFLIGITIGFSCTGISKKMDENRTYLLKKENEKIVLALEDDVKNKSLALFTFKGDRGKEYLAFQGFQENKILIYNIDSRELVRVISPQVEGSEGVGYFDGFYIAGLNDIFLTVGYDTEIFRIDSNAIIKERFRFDETIDGVSLNPYMALSSTYQPLIEIENKLYITSLCNRQAQENPVSAYIDLKTKKVHKLPFQYPHFSVSDDQSKMSSIEPLFSRCYDGKNFIYSFHYDENAYITTESHEVIHKKAIKSKYFKKVEIIDENQSTKDVLRQTCEAPRYGNLIYDPYRDVYYRIAYPSTKIDKNEDVIELLQYGGKSFSIIILNENLEIIGETLFPDNLYNSTMLFVREDGLYISDSHYLNPNFSDDILSFQRFDLVKPQ